MNGAHHYIPEQNTGGMAWDPHSVRVHKLETKPLMPLVRLAPFAYARESKECPERAADKTITLTQQRVLKKKTKPADPSQNSVDRPSRFGSDDNKLYCLMLTLLILCASG